MKTEQPSNQTVWIFLFLLCVLCWGLYNRPSDVPLKYFSAPAPQSREAQLKVHFSSWDGSHRGLTEVIKASMNDPNSYEHVDTVYRDKVDHLIVTTTFRGKNKFGGVVENWIKATVDLEDNVLEILEQGP